jgi:hypothetical protein
MSKEPTLGEKWNGFRAWLRRPKTLFDLKDRLKAIALLLLLSFLLFHLIKRLGW